jgi:hypothetical protein
MVNTRSDAAQLYVMVESAKKVVDAQVHAKRIMKDAAKIGNQKKPEADVNR